MASYQKVGDSYRASICVNYRRHTKNFPTLEEAQQWAAIYETKLRETTKTMHKTMGGHAERLVSMMSPRMLDALSRVSYRHADIVGGAVPFDGPRSGIYFLVRNGEVVYVGQSQDVLSRISRHKKDQTVRFDAFNFMPCAIDRLDQLEEAYTISLMPRHNRYLGPTAADIARRSCTTDTPASDGESQAIDSKQEISVKAAVVP